MRLILVAGSSYVEREQNIATAVSFLPVSTNAAIILEGLPSGQAYINPSSTLFIERVAPGCFCCIGHLVLKVTLNRLIRKKPAYIFVAMMNIEHAKHLNALLKQPPYDVLLQIEKIIDLP